MTAATVNHTVGFLTATVDICGGPVEGSRQVRNPAAVGWYPVDIVQFGRRHQAQRPVVTRTRFAAKQMHAIGPQRRRAVQRNIVAHTVAHREVGDLESQFFGELSGQRGALGFAGGDLTAGKFPTTRQLRWPNALRHQDRATADDGSGNHDLIQHDL